MNSGTAPVSVLNPAAELWDVVDAAMVINLDHRTDRWEKVQQHLKGIVPKEKLHRVSGVLGKQLDGYRTSRWFRRTRRPETWAGRAGCSVSHRNAMRLALEREWNWVLMIEDDAQFVRELDGNTGRALAAFLRDRGDKFGVVYLGYDSPKRPVRQLQAAGSEAMLYQIGGASTTHAYLVSATVMRRLLQGFPQSENDIWSWTAKHVVIDRWYSLNLHRWTGVAAISPQIAVQEPSISDITQRTSDYSEDSADNGLGSLSVSDAVWRLSTLTRFLVRPVTAVPRTVKAVIRCIAGF